MARVDAIRDLATPVCERAKDNIVNTDVAKVGVLLVGYGQPDEWDVEWPTETEQDLGSREAVLEKFEPSGDR